MKPIPELTIGEFGAYVAAHLQVRGIGVVLTGGSCVTIHSRNRYLSYDLDFIVASDTQRQSLQAALLELGFREKNSYFVHPESQYFVEFPPGPLAVGSEPAGEIVELDFPTGRLRLLSPTDCVKDRLAAYYHWQDRQCLEQAILVTADNHVDLVEIERWSRHEGMMEEFMGIKAKLVNASGSG